MSPTEIDLSDLKHKFFMRLETNLHSDKMDDTEFRSWLKRFLPAYMREEEKILVKDEQWQRQ